MSVTWVKSPEELNTLLPEQLSPDSLYTVRKSYGENVNEKGDVVYLIGLGTVPKDITHLLNVTKGKFFEASYVMSGRIGLVPYSGEINLKLSNGWRK